MPMGISPAGSIGRVQINIYLTIGIPAREALHRKTSILSQLDLYYNKTRKLVGERGVVEVPSGVPTGTTKAKDRCAVSSEVQKPGDALNNRGAVATTHACCICRAV
jgi:hypothetical protein